MYNSNLGIENLRLNNRYMFLKEESMQYESFSLSRYVDDPKRRIDVLNIVSELPANQCVALLAHFYGGLSVEEIATVMKSSIELTDNYLESACDKILHELEVADMSVKISDEASKKIVLKEIFEWYETEIIIDEQIQRVLEPILQMIRDGKFDKPIWFHKLEQ